MQTHQPCSEHASKAEHRVEGVPFCMECEIEALRGLLRAVANNTLVKPGHFGTVSLIMSEALWSKIQPLRNGAKEGNNGIGQE